MALDAWAKTLAKALDPSYKPKLLKRSGDTELPKLDTANTSNVLVLYTGGTIGMKSHGGVYSPEPNFLIPELKKMPLFHDQAFNVSDDCFKHPLVLPLSKEGKRVVYTVYEYEPLLDSCNMTIDDYARIAKDILENYEKFDGFVVLHGTDTMAYTASALSFMLEGLGKTVIVTGSQIPIFEARSDGRDNFLGALTIAGHYCFPEVTLFFYDKVMRGNRCTKVNSASFDAFHSPNLDPLAELGIHIDVKWESIWKPKGESKFQIHTQMSPHVGLLRLFPSITVETVRGFLQPPIQGVVMQSYGAGNGPDARQDLLDLFKEASSRGVLILNITQCHQGAVSTSYATGKALLDAGVIPGSDMTPEAALMKLAYILGKDAWNNEQKIEHLKMNLRGEMTMAETGEQQNRTDSALIQKLSEVMKLSSTEELETLKKSVIPSLCCSAAQSGNVEELKTLAKSGAVFTVGDYDGRTALHVAASAGHLPVVEYLLSEGVSLHVKDRYGHSALDDAVRFRRTEVIKTLVKAGAHLSIGPNKLGQLLCEAAAGGEVGEMESWQLAGADLNQADNSNRTALHQAAKNGRVNIVRFLVEKNAKVDVKDAQDKTPLDEAKAKGSEEIIKLLSK